MILETYALAEVAVGKLRCHTLEPAPAVQSAVITGEVRPRRLDDEAEEQLWRLVQAGFRERRTRI